MNLKNKNILVTGANGFIGSHLVPALRAAGYLVSTHSTRQGDIRNCTLDFEGIGHVFHLAARTFVPDSWSDPLSFYEVNLLGTVNVLEFCRSHGTSLTLISSYVYGPPARLPISEDEPLRAFNPYSHTKILAEETALYYQRQFAVPVTIIRPFNVYGPGQDRRFLIPTILWQAIDPGQAAIEVADLNPRRDYIFIADLVDLTSSHGASEGRGCVQCWQRIVMGCRRRNCPGERFSAHPQARSRRRPGAPGRGRRRRRGHLACSP